VEQQLVVEARARRARQPLRTENRAALITSGSFLTAATVFAVSAGSSRSLHIGLAAVLVGGFALLTQLELELGSGSAVPTQLCFVPMLFALPLPLVPLAVCAGYLLGGVLDAARGHVQLARSAALPGCCWFSLPPALILLYLDHERGPDWRHWPILLAALAAQCAGDLVSSSVHQRLAHGIAPRQLLRPLASVYLFDALLSPVALLAIVAARANAFALVASLPLVAILAQLARERRRRISSQLDAARLEALAYADPLTGLANRRVFDAGLAARIDEVGDRRAGRLSVCILDLDHFKDYNDQHGHPAGDRLLQAAATAWSSELRPGDLIARIGGEEFAILLPGCGRRDAERIATRLLAVCPAGSTCSAGLVSWDGAETAGALTERADSALYAAKREGRGRLIAA
jgi:diguanylate cyclase (GGDEF)-like protein